MFVDNAVAKDFNGEERYDKFAIASTLFDVSFRGAVCSLRRAEILNSCEGCNLKFMCRKIDEIEKEFTQKTTVVTERFSFSKQ